MHQTLDWLLLFLPKLLTNAARSATLLIVPAVSREVSFGDPRPGSWYEAILRQGFGQLESFVL